MMDVVVDYEWGDIVVGADLDAVRFAYDNKYFLIKNRPPHHHSYEAVEQEWAEKIYQLHDMGLVPFADKPNNIRVLSEEKLLKIFTDNGAYNIKYDKLYLYDDENVVGLSLDRKLVHYRVVDWFDCRGLYDLGFSSIKTSDEFINIIRFFKSTRVDGNQKYMDLLSESFLSEDQLKDFDYSDTMARLKIENLLADNGIHNTTLSLWKRDVYPVYK